MRQLSKVQLAIDSTHTVPQRVMDCGTDSCNTLIMRFSIYHIRLNLQHIAQSTTHMQCNLSLATQSIT